MSEIPTPNPTPGGPGRRTRATRRGGRPPQRRVWPRPLRPATACIAIDDFMKVELRTAKILAAERLPKSKKLLKLSVDAGEPQPRTILAGIAESYEPEAIVGRSIVIVANLKPREMMGMVSNGMVLAASTDGGPAMLVNPDPAPPAPASGDARAGRVRAGIGTGTRAASRLTQLRRTAPARLRSLAPAALP